MERKLIGICLLVLASGGCRMCSSCCDNLPPVLDGPYSGHGTRAGSAFNYQRLPAPSEAEEITSPAEVPASEDS